MKFKVGDKVRWSLIIMGSKTTELCKVKKVTGKYVTIEEEPQIRFSPSTGEELDNQFNGINSYIKVVET